MSANLSPQAKEALASKTLTCVVGISAIGKNTVMSKTAELYPEFCVSSGFTTRPPKFKGESAYRAYLPHTPETVESLYTATGEDALVQLEIHETTNYLYGTQMCDYRKPFPLLDTLSVAVPKFQVIGFGACRTVVFTSEPQQWKDRFNHMQFTSDTAKARITEGISSLEWSLDHADEVAWLVNANDRVVDSARLLRKAALGQELPYQISAQHLGYKTLKLLRSLAA